MMPEIRRKYNFRLIAEFLRNWLQQTEAWIKDKRVYNKKMESITWKKDTNYSISPSGMSTFHGLTTPNTIVYWTPDKHWQRIVQIELSTTKNSSSEGPSTFVFTPLVINLALHNAQCMVFEKFFHHEQFLSWKLTKSKLFREYQSPSLGKLTHCRIRRRSRFRNSTIWSFRRKLWFCLFPLNWAKYSQ